MEQNLILLSTLGQSGSEAGRTANDHNVFLTVTRLHKTVLGISGIVLERPKFSAHLVLKGVLLNAQAMMI